MAETADAMAAKLNRWDNCMIIFRMLKQRYKLFKGGVVGARKSTARAGGGGPWGLHTFLLHAVHR